MEVYFWEDLINVVELLENVNEQQDSLRLHKKVNPLGFGQEIFSSMTLLFSEKDKVWVKLTWSTEIIQFNIIEFIKDIKYFGILKI